MANDKKFVVKNGLQTQNISFVDSDKTNTIYARMLSNDALAFSGNAGQLFSISDSLSGTIFAVNDISGVPSIEVDDDGEIRLAETFGHVLIGTDSSLNTGTYILQVNGGFNADSATIDGSVTASSLTTSGDITADTVYADGGNLIIGDEALSSDTNYVGMKTSNQSGSGDYMIISGISDGATYVSSKSGTGTYIRGPGNSSTYQLAITGSGATFSSNLTVSGDLTVSGTTTTINTETINLADNIIVLNSNETGTPSQDAGIEVERGTSTNKTFKWDETNDRWLFDDDVCLLSATPNLVLQHSSVNQVNSGALRLTEYLWQGGGIKYDGANNLLKIFTHEQANVDSSWDINAITITRSSGQIEIENVNSTINGNRILSTADEGSGNGLDADTVDGIQGASFLRSDAADTATGLITLEGGLKLNNTSSQTNYIQFGPGPASNDDAHIEWLGGSNAGYLRISTSDDVGTEYIEFGDYDNTARGGTFTQWAKMSRNSVLLPDNSKLNLGTSSDLQIYFNGSNGRIDNTTGVLQLVNYANDQDVNIYTDDGSGGITTYFSADGSTGETKLYHYGSEKIKTLSTGVTVTGRTTTDTLTFDSATFTGTTIALRTVDSDGTQVSALSFEGDAGQLFSIVDSMGGTIFSVNDISGIPSIEVDDDGQIRLAEFGGEVLIGTSTDAGNYLLQVAGNVYSSGTYTGNGSGLTNLNASNISSGTISDARLPATISSDITGNAATVTATANNSTNETVYLTFVDGATGSQGIETDTSLTYNPSTNLLAIASDTDISAEIGRTHIGYMTGIVDYAGFSHIDQNSSNNYALLQNASGATYLNAASGQNVIFRNNNSTVMTMSSSGLYAADNKYLAAGSGQDLQIYHNATSSFITNYTGGLTIRNGATDADVLIETDNGSGSETAYFRADGSTGEAILYHYGSEKLKTQSTGVSVTGLLSATTKSFIIDHPTKPNHKLRYGSLEGPENGVYVRGRLKGGNTIELPEYWKGLVHEDSITVELTAIGKHQKLYVEDFDNTKVIVGNDNLMSKEINCFYTVYGERKDVDKLEVEYES